MTISLVNFANPIEQPRHPCKTLRQIEALEHAKARLAVDTRSDRACSVELAPANNDQSAQCGNTDAGAGL